MNIPERISALEQQLAQHTERRAQATAVLNESQTAILQLQGALAVLRELLSENGMKGSPSEPMA